MLLECADIGKEYGGLTVLDEVTLTLPPKGLFGLCGPNGAGKSTLLGIIGGSVPPARGRVLLDGADVTRLPPQQRFGLGISRTFQTVHLIRGRTVLDNVAVACLTSHRSGIASRLFRSELVQARQQAEQTLARLGMTALSGRDVSSLTLENQRMVELARAIAARPRLLLLDEPGIRAQRGRAPAARRTAARPGRAHLRAACGTRPGSGRADQPADLRSGRGAARLRRQPRRLPGFGPCEFTPRWPLGG